MRRLLAAMLLVAIAGCGEPSRERSSAPQSESAGPAADGAAPRSARRDGGPNVSPTAAPGVAFNYRYAFRLAADRVAEVQERHAAACEGLGVARCRITGMSYRLVGDRDVSAQLRFGLDPSLARRFGRAGVEAVTQAEGLMIESQISGQDVGTGIRADGRSIAQLQDELRRIEARIADPDVSADEKVELRQEAAALRDEIRALGEGRQDAQASLATTPMVFDYGSGSYGSDAPDFGATLSDAWDGFLWGLYGLFVVVMTLLPWIALGALVWLAVRWGLRQARRRRPAVAVETPAS